MVATIRFSDGESVKVMNRFTIPNWLDRYLEEECVIFDERDDLPTTVPHVEHCQLCLRDFEEATKSRPQLCRHSPINREFGYVAKICVDCLYYIERELGLEAIPKSIKATLDSGHRVKMLEHLIN